MWRVDVSPDASRSIQEFDAILKEELIAHVEIVADEPGQALRAAMPKVELADTLVYEYESQIVPPLRIALFFANLDARSRRMSLVAIRRAFPPEDPT
jgi:hypothetical protein